MYRRIFLAALSLALLVPCFLTAAGAQSAFEVSNIHVDATAASTAEARSNAIAGGRSSAWGVLYKRLTRQQDWARQPVLAPAQLQKLIIGYFPVNERRSSRRYVADVTYTFSPDAVARLLQAAAIPYTAMAAKRILLVPMAPGYARNSSWTTVFSSPRFASAAVPFSLPLGDAQDGAALTGLAFDTARWDDVAAVAARVHATEAVLVLANVNGNKLDVSLKRLGPGTLPSKTTLELPLLQTTQGTYPGAADAAVRAIDDMWKNQKAVDFSQKGKLTVDVHIASLGQFAALENAMAGVPNVTDVGVAAMDIGQARLTLSYIGSIDQLRAALAGAGVVLTNRGGNWQISQGSVPVQP